MSAEWTIELLEGRHKRDEFSCGEPSLDDYIRKYARQNAKANVARTYVLTKQGNLSVVGYYTVCRGSIAFETVPGSDRRRLPKHPIPTAHLARLAVDSPSQGKGFGEALLFNCLRRVSLASQEMGIYAITVDALHEKAKSFYSQYGFVELTDDPMHLYLLTATAAAAVAAGLPSST